MPISRAFSTYPPGSPQGGPLFVALVIQYAKRMLRIVTCGLSVYAIRGLLEKYPTFGREKETGLLGALDT